MNTQKSMSEQLVDSIAQDIIDLLKKRVNEITGNNTYTKLFIDMDHLFQITSIASMMAGVSMICNYLNTGTEDRVTDNFDASIINEVLITTTKTFETITNAINKCNPEKKDYAPLRNALHGIDKRLAAEFTKDANER